MKEQLKSIIDSRRKQLCEYQVRQLVLLVGDSSWAEKVIEFLSCDHQESLLVYSDIESIASDVAVNNTKQYLGTETSNIAFYTNDFSPEVFAILAGTLKAGGIFFLNFTPSAISSSLFTRYFLTQAKNSTNQIVIEQGQEISIANNFLGHNVQSAPDNLRGAETKSVETESVGKTNAGSHSLCLTVDQKNAVQLIIESANRRRKKCATVITADRGRGKSSALAIACGQILATSKRVMRIGISAAKKHSLNIFYRQLESTLNQLLGQPDLVKGALEHVKFCAVDELTLNELELDLLLIDEASAIPVPILEQLVIKYKKTIFASTVHGYEGAGRGFSLKFLTFLRQYETEHNDKICVYETHLNSPIRWATGCPFEEFTFNALLLNADIKSLSPNLTNVSSNDMSLLKPNKHELAQNSPLLSQAFGLLVGAHYQTSTNDFKLLLDNDCIDIYCLTIKQSKGVLVVGVALMFKEYSLPKQIQADVISGSRRLRDHFTAQSITQHLGFKEALSHGFYRVMRIAIHPDLQNKGVGKYLLKQVEESQEANSLGGLSTSFGINDSLFKFWQKNGYSLIRLGSQKDHASGEYSGLFIKAINKDVEHLVQALKIQFSRSFFTNLLHVWHELTPELVSEILQDCNIVKKENLTPYDIQTIDDFAQGRRQLLPCLHSIKLGLVHRLAVEFDSTLTPLIDYMLKNHPLDVVYQQHGFTGKKQFTRYCQKTCANLLEPK